MRGLEEAREKTRWVAPWIFRALEKLCASWRLAAVGPNRSNFIFWHVSLAIQISSIYLHISR